MTTGGNRTVIWRTGLAAVALSSLTGAAGIVLPGREHEATGYFINPGAASSFSVGGALFSAEYRLSNGGFDQSLANGSAATSVAAGSTFLSANLGKTTELSKQTYQFSLSYRTGEGLIFAMARMTPAGANPVSSVLAWGHNWVPALPGPPAQVTVKATLPNADGLETREPTTDFNTLLIEATVGDPGSKAASPTLSFGQLAFASPTLRLVSGEFADGTVTPSTHGPESAAGTWQQWLIAEGSLARNDWALTGLVHGGCDGSMADDLVRFTIHGHQAEVAWETDASLAEPATAVSGGVLALASFGAVGWFRRKKAFPG